MDATSATITQGRWRAARAAVRTIGERLAALIETVGSRAMATRHWSVADAVARVVVVACGSDAFLGAPGRNIDVRVSYHPVTLN